MKQVKHLCQLYTKRQYFNTGGIVCPVSDLSVLRVNVVSGPSGLKNSALSLHAHTL